MSWPCRHHTALRPAAAPGERDPRGCGWAGRLRTLRLPWSTLWPACFAAGLLLQGCSSAPVRPGAPAGSAVSPRHAPAASVGSEIAIRAISLLGSPYRYGGEGPRAFDCSGLVWFVHEQLGIAVPRTAAAQYSAATPVNIDELEPGDLLFFRIDGARVSHVAIYTGEGRFIHAPKTGRPVELRTLDDAYYEAHLAGAGRLFR